MKTVTVFSPTLANELIDLGYQIIKVQNNVKTTNGVVFYFADEDGSALEYINNYVDMSKLKRKLEEFKNDKATQTTQARRGRKENS